MLFIVFVWITLFGEVPLLRISRFRSSISTVIQAAQTPDLLYAILTAKHQLVNLIRPKKYILQPAGENFIL